MLVPWCTRIGKQKPPDFRRQHEALARHVTQRCAKAVFGQALAVMRGGIEVRKSQGHSVANRRDRIFIGHDTEEIAERCAAQAQRRAAKSVRYVSGKRHAGPCYPRRPSS